MTSKTFEQVIVQVLQGGGVDISLFELIEVCGFDAADELGSALAVREKIEAYGLGMFPGFTEGGLRTGRVLRSSSASATYDLHALLIQNEESSSLELKSSMVCDMNRLKSTGQRFRSDAVTHSVLKTICGLANAAGGTLLVGVDDEKRIVGLSDDYACGIGSSDRWQIELSNFISGRVLHGSRVDPYATVNVVQADGFDVAIINVVARRELTFLRSEDNKRWEYYVRNGNKTDRIDIESFEEHLVRKRGYQV